MSSLFPVFLLLVITAGLMTASALFIPKGPNQVVIRTALLVGLVAFYLLWMITYMAQLHPLIAPVRTVGKL
ncbi:hypothetical protein K443DRAFT_510438 [Laccaria amethystina LaAM-08-1]|uniref:V-type proton ATPase subunit n=1 Tax=Laccaria amethystina LaAM-08-1 TaxID=1095629 RepID=A0A0C9WMC2_9AGAR|nr:hypothetical protein K443DRAFT_510438 [Laccaria amethystina LaAM-08-1]